jgi:hypothetical protein
MYELNAITLFCSSICLICLNANVSSDGNLRGLLQRKTRGHSLEADISEIFSPGCGDSHGELLPYYYKPFS